ncbi:type ISP restriction/modification enzyme [Novosphingobium humi]|uniref:site-specific DNA-methyltransferase (adenine-specific) n=1 Tax=Novosphingobium humi TaxID=2282397 RepID=A0ABY7TYR3_9SPHN|nr:type ISP restriction/modification enzyme [Novosphingobium humi]WCT77757.1 hypothetical protein PQ457_01905 [Novosphingobium humi]
MTDITAEELAKVNSFPRLVSLLRDKLDWPINEEYEFEDVIFEYEPQELGLKADETAKLREIHQLRPLVTGQPWGIFFLSFDDKAMSVTVLRRILRALVVKQRASGQSADRAAWEKEDLIFAANFGKSGERELAFVHFSDGASTGDLPAMKVLGWNHRDTTLHNRHAADLLTKRLAWPDDPADQTQWRNQWASAFEVGHREVITTSQELAKRLAALAGDIRARANQLLAAETDKGPMRTMLEAFRKNLIHDLDEDGFADMFAQTICYGMLAARISRPSAEDGKGVIVADNLADMVPKTNPFLKELFASFLKIGGRDRRSGMDFDELGVRDVVDMLNRANMERVLEDFGNRNPKKDPVIHFYEDFLREYDKDQKVDAGIFYTPPAVVGFIVRSVDERLRKEFSLPLGLADTSTWAELATRNDKIAIPGHVKPEAPFVQILDPATGTGTFLVEVIDLIHKRMVETWKAEGKSSAKIKAAWNDYVPHHLLPRITAFELKMAAYAIAHMKIGLKLSETGYTFGSDERLHVLLTNSLQPPRALDLDERARQVAFAHEAERANDAKQCGCFTVVVGNPPYNGYSVNSNNWIDNLLKAYKINVGREERQIQRLSNDYVKFFRFSEWLIQRSGYGVFSFIVDAGYLDGILFRDMRASLARTYANIQIVDLHGASVRGAHDRDTSDENVFDITQPNCIFIGTKLGDQGRVQYVSLTGSQEMKFSILDRKQFAALGPVDITPVKPHFYLKPHEGDDVYEAWPDILSLIGTGRPTQDRDFRYGTGIKTRHDHFAVGWSNADAVSRILTIANRPEEGPALVKKLKLCSTSHFSIADARERAEAGGLEDFTASLAYRPFDRRTIVYLRQFICEPKFKTMGHLVRVSNLALCVLRKNRRETGSNALVGESLVAKDYVSDLDDALVFPLWIADQGVTSGRLPNLHKSAIERAFADLKLTYDDGIPRGQQGSLGKEFIKPKPEQIGLLDTPWDGRGDLAKSFGPRDLFDYIYTVLHAPTYRSRYAEFLKSNFPRIPMPGSRALFADLVPLGRELVALHLLKPDEAPALKTPEIRFAGSGEARVGKGYPEYTNGKVMINASRWFEDVPLATWEFHVGGYQPCEKWLKDRAAKGGKKQSDGRVLTDEDVLHYRRMVTALTETRRIMAEIDKVIETHGGWPGAFKLGGEE